MIKERCLAAVESRGGLDKVPAQRVMPSNTGALADCRRCGVAALCALYRHVPRHGIHFVGADSSGSTNAAACARSSKVLLAFIAAWGIDGANSTWALFTGQALIYPPDNILRLATGFGAGFSIACALSPIYAGSFRDGADASPVLAPFWRLPAVLGLAGGTFTLVLLWQICRYGCGQPCWLPQEHNIAVVLRMVFQAAIL